MFGPFFRPGPNLDEFVHNFPGERQTNLPRVRTYIFCFRAQLNRVFEMQQQMLGTHNRHGTFFNSVSFSFVCFFRLCMCPARKIERAAKDSKTDVVRARRDDSESPPSCSPVTAAVTAAATTANEQNMEAPLAVALSQSMDSVNTATGEEEWLGATRALSLTSGRYTTPIHKRWVYRVDCTSYQGAVCVPRRQHVSREYLIALPTFTVPRIARTLALSAMEIVARFAVYKRKIDLVITLARQQIVPVFSL
ncbi:hypothetical protein CBL_07440 [Carabus blaptoides fortunei]